MVLKPHPFQVFFYPVNIGLTGATSVVVLDSQMDMQVPFFCGSPDVKCGKKVTFVKVTCGARGEPDFSGKAGWD